MKCGLRLLRHERGDLLKPAFALLPERRRRVLDDLRRMQGRADLKAAKRKSNINAILAKNIGGIIGLGLEPDGRLRILPQPADYAAIGALVNEHSAETVWFTACEIAGATIEGDPLDYLRAALRPSEIEADRSKWRRPLRTWTISMCKNY